ncbi:unknown [Bacteroides sp. CAG:545]|nr:unknown [Bacteroides sp. CAG:545]
MRHKNFGAEAQLPPFHSKESSQDNPISQIMEHINSRNELSQEVQILQSIIETIKEVSEKIDKDKAGLRTVVDVMDQVHAMLSSETEGLFDLQKQVRSQVVEMCQKSVPLSLPDDVGAKLNTICQNALNETSRKMKETQAEYLRDIQKHNEKFLADLSTNKGVWLSRKVFWWSAGIAYVLSLLGFCIIIWNIVH